ncbi:DUF58 domain-containing protein [Peribacillus simplex]|nr:DUF58 domain-containing protein [Peribacillus simplex]
MGSYAFLEKLQKKRLLVKTRKRGMHKGSRKSSAFGSSLEFSDFRAYQPGDDVRQIDWNVFGRTQKHYIKRFLDEQELSVAIYLDVTSSMRALPDKWEQARQLAASLSFVVLAGEDRLAFIPVASKTAHPIRRKGAVHRKGVFREIAGLEETEKSGHFYNQLGKVMLKNHQLSIIISDGLEPLDQVEATLRKMRSAKQEIWFIQLLGKEDLNPAFNGDLKLVDSELDTAVNVSIHPSLIGNYRTRLTEHNQKLEGVCRSFGCHYILISAQTDIQMILFQDFPRHGLMN